MEVGFRGGAEARRDRAQQRLILLPSRKREGLGEGMSGVLYEGDMPSPNPSRKREGN